MGLDRFDLGEWAYRTRLLRLDAVTGELNVLVSAAEWAARSVATLPADLASRNGVGMGRQLFASMRRNAVTAEEGAMTWL